MKAKEYFNMKKDLLTPDLNVGQAQEITKDIFADFAVELKLIVDSRKVKSDKGCLAAIREQNQKWNSLRVLFIEAGYDILQRDGFEKAITIVLKEGLKS